MTGKIDGIFVELKATVDASGVVTGEKQITASAKKIQDEFHKSDAVLSKSSKQLARHAKQAGKSANSTMGMGRSAGQASIQLQQFTGQVSGGVNPLIAFSQQAADLGIVLGAPLLGSIVGIGAAIGVVLLPEIFKSTDALADLDAVSESLQKSLKNSKTGTIELSESIAKLADRSSSLARLQISSSLIDAEKQISIASEGIVDAVDDTLSAFQGAMTIGEAGDIIRRVGGDVDDLAQKLEGTKSLSLAGLSSKLNEISSRFGISRESAAGFILAIDELNRTKSPAAVKQLENQLTKLNDETGGSSERIAELGTVLLPLFDAMNSGVDNTNALRIAFADLNKELKKPSEAKALTEAEIVADSLVQQVALVNAKIDGGADAARRLALAFELGSESSEALPENVSKLLTELEAAEAKTREIAESDRVQAQASAKLKRDLAASTAKAEREELQATAKFKAQIEAQEAKEKTERGSNLAQLQADAASEEELLKLKFARQFVLLEESRIKDGLAEDTYNNLKKTKAQQLADELLAIEKRKTDATNALAEAERQAKISALGSTFGALSSLMNTESRKLFAIGKAAAMSSAIVDSYQAIVKTMASVPYPFNVPLAAAQAVAGAVQVKNIANQKFGGAPSGSSFSGGLPAVNTQQAPQQQQNQNINISGINADSLITGGQLVSTLNAALGDGYTINFAGG